MEIAQWIGIAAGVLIVVYIIGSKLIARYFQQTDKIESLREGWTSKRFEEIKKDLYEVKAQIAVLDKKVVAVDVKIVGGHDNTQKLFRKLEGFIASTEKRFTQIEESELIPIGGDRFILRTKKDG